MPLTKVSSVKIQKIDHAASQEEVDLLAVEEPLEIRVGFGPETDRQQKSVSVTMRTPGNDLELAAGFLFTEGIISSPGELLTVSHCNTTGEQENPENIVRAELHPDVSINLKSLERHFYTSSSCGVCGKTSIEAVRIDHCQTISQDQPIIHQEIIRQLPEKLHNHQTIFKHTGGLHASALFDGSGALKLIREDVGRHNALDKLIGAALLSKSLPLANNIVLVSGRASFELIQKAVLAGCPILAAVGAPSSLAVSLAKEFGMTLIGFLKNDRFNIYSHMQRIAHLRPQKIV